MQVGSKIIFSVGQMKTSKSAHRPMKSMGGSPIRKSQMPKKTRRISGSPHRVSGLSRPLSPIMKRGISPRKHSLSPHQHSIVSPTRRSVIHSSQADRLQAIKRQKYEKKKSGLSPPLTRRIPSVGRPASSSQVAYDRYQDTESISHTREYDSPPKKKFSRDNIKFRHSSSESEGSARRPIERSRLRSASRSPPRNKMHPSVSSMHSQNVPHERDKSHYLVQSRQRSSYNSSQPLKEPPLKSSYGRKSMEGYRSASPNDRYVSDGDKRYAPTLSDRFRSVVDSGHDEPRIRYTKEDLEKITIDIRRNLRDRSPTLRRITNPSDVKLVHRQNAGHRPIFDREEIKQAPRDLREDAYYEHKLLSRGEFSSYGFNWREMENYEITRHRFDSYHTPMNSGTRRTLNDRWQNPEARKSIDRDDRERNYESEMVEVPRSADRDLRHYPSTSRPDYQESEPRMYASSRMAVRRKEVPLKMAEKIRSKIHPEKRFPERMSRERSVGEHRSSKWSHDSRSHSREKEFVRRPDKYYKPWPPKDEAKGANYFEHEGRSDKLIPYRGRGRGFRGPRGFRGRGFRSRGRGRGIFRGSRGRGAPRRGRLSPGFWEHDLYSRMSQERRAGSHA